MRKRPAQRRIHAAALRLFAERGTPQISISELAHEADLARGTIYNNISEPNELFENIAAELVEEMYNRITDALKSVEDPAERVSIAVRLFIRQAHEEPVWGRFLLRFAFSSSSLRGLLIGPPQDDLKRGLDNGRFGFRADQLASAAMYLSASTMSGMLLTREGTQTWREAGADVVEFLLRGFGLPTEEARRIASIEVPEIPRR